MGKLVFKEQAIDSICVNICGKSHNDCGFWKFNFEMCNACKFARLVESTPFAERTGKWIDRGSLSCRCSECGCKSPKEYTYCPNCGALMQGEEDADEITE